MVLGFGMQLGPGRVGDARTDLLERLVVRIELVLQRGLHRHGHVGVEQATVVEQHPPDVCPLLALTECVDPESPHQGEHPVMIGVDPLRATLGVLTAHEPVVHRARPAACTRAALDQLHVHTRTEQSLCDREPGHARADDEYPHDRGGLLSYP